MRPSLRVLFWIGIVAELSIIGVVLSDNHLKSTHPIQTKSAWVDPVIHSTIINTIILEPKSDIKRSAILNDVKQGMDLLKEGKISKARQKFMVAYNAGEFLGAVGLSQSYDWNVLRLYHPRHGKRFASNKLRDVWQSRVNDMLQMTDDLKRNLSAAKSDR